MNFGLKQLSLSIIYLHAIVSAYHTRVALD
jgi:hypothetical protein